ncbi:START domain-containing protein 10-like [Anneissia japonica]|uniref:START domain-containing protein 10-like n=1 Tax=Anneissia japonica TaxID=1529436 RepID=UPI00142573C9|nr:START domain-containing protein 10-like [Anneissia japonica]
MAVGEVKYPEDEDFQVFRNLADSVDGWTEKYNKNGTKVWAKNSDTSCKMFKAHKVFPDLAASVMYDVLHDSEFRGRWDSTMEEGKEMYMVCPNSDVSYYQLKCPSPFKNRDFLMQRIWLETLDAFYIFNHSVFHKDVPERKGVIRAESILTGYLVRSNGKGCELTYVTQSDPRGSLPKWIVNKLTQYLAPKMMNRLHKACLKYPSWKKKNSPYYKPWLNPEQLNIPRLDMNDLLPRQEYTDDDSLDESQVKEDDIKEDDINCNDI